MKNTKFLFYILIYSFNSIINSEILNLNTQIQDEKYANIILNYQDEYLKKNIRKNKDETLVISIGGACLAAIEISRFGLRHCAYPFDVIFSELEGVIQAIKTNFSFYLDKKYLTKKLLDNSLHLYNSFYKFTFPHDLQNSNPNVDFNSIEFKEFEEKYKRRITRFNDLENFKGKVYFLRTFSQHISKDNPKEIINLRNLIFKKFPKLNFEIIVVNQDTNEVEKANNIKYFYSSSLALFAKKTDYEFNKIFNSLSIKTQPKEPITFSELNN